MTADSYMALPYTLQVLMAFDGVFEADVVELPGCLAHGKTPDEAKKRLAVLQRHWIDSCIKSGETVPLPARL